MEGWATDGFDTGRYMMLCVRSETLVIWGMCPFIADWHTPGDLDLLRLVSVVLWADILIIYFELWVRCVNSVCIEVRRQL